MKKSKINKNFILLAGIGIMLIITTVVIISFFRFDVLINNLNKGVPVKILFAVADENELKFLELFIYSSVTKKAGIYHLPANLGLKLTSLNRVDAIGVLYKNNDLGKLKDEVERTTDSEIGFYISFQTSKLVQLIDQIEGVELFISNPVDIEYNGKRVLIPSGNVVLDGDKALDYILYEDINEESRENIYRKQKVLQAILKKWGDAAINTELLNNNGFSLLMDSMQTNITPREMRAFIVEMQSFDSEHIIFQRVEGKITEIDKKQLLFPYFEGDIIKRSIKQIFENVTSNEIFDGGALDVTLEILNGTDKNGLAAKTAAVFTQLGYDVVNITNADRNTYEKTVIREHWGKVEKATEVARIIKCKLIESKVGEDLENTPQITIILGADFDGRYCKE